MIELLHKQKKIAKETPEEDAKPKMSLAEFKEKLKFGGNSNKMDPKPPVGYSGKDFDFENFRNLYVSRNRNEKIQALRLEATQLLED